METSIKPKNIILLSDGTGNANIINRGTNVFRLYEAIDFNLDDHPQIAFYDNGIGTQTFTPVALFCGATGWGLSHNIQVLYKELVRVYVPGDRIFMFGFSRGAFTVRSLAGLIASKGILDISKYSSPAELDHAVSALYEHYRGQHPAIGEKLGRAIRNLLIPEKEPVFHCLEGEEHRKIAFIGVWDTVDAVGTPFKELTDFWDRFIYKFKFSTLTLNRDVGAACQAFALDEKRQSFTPVIWEKDDRIEQVWFSGVHSNVGGGYPQRGMALVALDWMMKKAAANGLVFVKEAGEFVYDHRNELDKLYDSRAGFGAYYRYRPRVIEHKEGALHRFHVTLFRRIAAGVNGYAPGNIIHLKDFIVVDTDGSFHPCSQKIVDLVHHARHKPDPMQIEQLTRARQAVYYVMLIDTIYGIIRLCRDYPEQQYTTLGVIVLVGMVFYALGNYFQNKMESQFCEFWFHLREDLKGLL